MTLFRIAICTIVTTIASLNLGSFAAAQSVILTVTGEMSLANNKNTIDFDRYSLKKMAWKDVTVENSFLDGTHSFSGTPLADLLRFIGVSSGKLRALALDGYSVEIPVSDAFQKDVILAMDHNGKPMRIRDRGPIWLIYPKQKDLSYRSSDDEKMIWQLRYIEILSD